MGWFTVWLVHLGLWLVYVSQVSAWELLVGAAAAGLATLGLAVVRRVGFARCSLDWGPVAEAWRIPWYAVSGTWQLLQGIGKQLFSKKGAPSYLAAVDFEVGREDPAGVARRALAVVYTTMTPNSVVVGIVREQRLLLYHQIVPGEVMQITRNLGANP